MNKQDEQLTEPTKGPPYDVPDYHDHYQYNTEFPGKFWLAGLIGMLIFGTILYLIYHFTASDSIIRGTPLAIFWGLTVVFGLIVIGLPAENIWRRWKNRKNK